MASYLETKAKEAFIDDHFELALDLYSQAIELNRKNAELYADRAQTNIKLNYLLEAVADANKAIELDPSTSKAYLRKATACMKLEEYQTAKAALETGAALAPGESRFSKLIKECEERIAEETDDLQKQTLEEVTTNVVPQKEVESDKDLLDPVTVAAPPKPTHRHDFYQKPDEVVVTIFAKGILHECVSVDYDEQILSVTINAHGKDAYHFQPRLFGKIIPDKCRYDVLSTKIEIRLAKAEPIQWASLEFSREVAVPQRVKSSITIIQRPVYPSSKPKRVDWDKLEAQVKKEEKDEKLDGDAANKFFRDIYQDADEDTRRAMQKSFVRYFNSRDCLICPFNMHNSGVKWDSAFDKLERGWCKEGGRKSSGWYGNEEVVVLGSLFPMGRLEWIRPLHTLIPQQDHKLMFGLLFSLKSLTAKMVPISAGKGNLGVPHLPGQGCSFHSFRTNTYKLSFMETPSGIKFILVTNPRTGDLRETLKYIYNLYVEYVAKNPLYTPGTPIRCELFNTALDQFVRSITLHSI
ncbi:hypothetical protein CRYUN_Cryun13aG0082100 [Craigia yunnanensis]